MCVVKRLLSMAMPRGASLEYSFCSPHEQTVYHRPTALVLRYANRHPWVLDVRGKGLLNAVEVDPKFRVRKDPPPPFPALPPQQYPPAPPPAVPAARLRSPT